MTNPDSFCSAPFKSVLIDKNGSLIPCCEFMADQSQVPNGNISDFATWWNQDLQGLRDSFVQGKKDNGCLHCDKKEKMFNSLHGHRIYQNQTAILPLESYATQETNTVEQLEIRFGNYCNLKCIMCGEYASSSIASEYIKHQAQYNTIGIFMDTEPVERWWENEQSLRNLEFMLTTVRKCVFSGGEPLIVPELLKILDSIESDCELVFISNLTRVTDALLQKLSRFKFISIIVSCEGTGEHNDYVRFGSKWATIQDNVLRLQQYNNIKITVNHVLQHTSIFALPSLMSWCQQHSLHLSLSPVYEHSYPAPGVLGINSAHPTDVKRFSDWLSSKSKNSNLDAWLKQYVYDPALNKQFHGYVTMLDSIRNLNFYTTFNPTYDNTQH